VDEAQCGCHWDAPIVLMRKRRDSEAQEELTFVDVGGVGLLARLGALLLVTRGSGLLAGLLLLGGGLGSGSLGGGLLLSGGFGRHFESLGLVGDEGWLMKVSEMGVGVGCWTWWWS
jgi:hypothetical protein